MGIVWVPLPIKGVVPGITLDGTHERNSGDLQPANPLKKSPKQVVQVGPCPFVVTNWSQNPTYLGVFKNRGTPKWMVYFMENPIKMDDLGGKKPNFWFNTHMVLYTPFFGGAMNEGIVGCTPTNVPLWEIPI